jgi:hypothetical protein
MVVNKKSLISAILILLAFIVYSAAILNYPFFPSHSRESQKSLVSVTEGNVSVSEDLFPTVLNVEQVSDGDREDCFYLNDSVERYYCFASLGINVSLDCESLNDLHQRKDCYYGLAKKEASPDAVCEVLSGYERLGCYRDLATAKFDPSLCGVYENILERYVCFGWVAGESQNRDFCGLIPDGGEIQEWGVVKASNSVLYDLCLVGVESGKRDKRGELCVFVRDNDLKQYCGAVSKHDNSLCEGISSELRKRKCIRDVEYIKMYAGRRNPYFPDRSWFNYQAVFNTIRGVDNEVILW